MNPAPVTRQRLDFAAALAVTIPLGLASRRFAASLPPFVAEYAGDTLWALAMYLAVSIAAPRLGIRARAVIALATSCLVELSQLYHAPWIDDTRATTLGALLLGAGFLWSDLVCYAVGVAIGVVGERCLQRATRGTR